MRSAEKLDLMRKKAVSQCFCLKSVASPLEGIVHRYGTRL